MILAELIQIILAVPVAQAAEVFSCVSEAAQPQGLVPLFNPENKGIMAAVIATTGFFDGINYRSLPLIVLLLGHLIAFTKTRREAIRMGLLFVLTVFFGLIAMSTFLIGLVGQLIDWPLYPQLIAYIKYFFVLLLLGSALFNFHEFFFVPKFIPRVLESIKERFSSKQNIFLYAWTILVAIIALLFIIPCSLISFVGTVSFSYVPLSALIGYIVLYSFMFIVPLIIILAIAVRIEWFVRHREISSDKHRGLKLIKALAQLALAGLLLFI